MEKTSKFTTITLWVMMAISAVLMVIMLTSIDSQSNPGPRAVSMITTNINWAIVLLIISAIITVGFALVQMLSDMKKAVTALAILAGFAVIVLVSYFSSSAEIPQFFGVEKYIADGTLTVSIARWTSAGLYMTYILFAGAALSIAGFGVASVFKRS